MRFLDRARLVIMAAITGVFDIAAGMARLAADLALASVVEREAVLS